MIELIRNKNIEQALDYAQSHLVERAEEGSEVRHGCILLLVILFIGPPKLAQKL